MRHAVFVCSVKGLHVPHGMHGDHFCAVVSCNGWMLALTWNADVKHEPAELVAGAEQKQMNAEATARKTSPQFSEHLYRNGAVS